LTVGPVSLPHQFLIIGDITGIAPVISRKQRGGRRKEKQGEK
jgi:hypothetical protein